MPKYFLRILKSVRLPKIFLAGLIGLYSLVTVITPVWARGINEIQSEISTKNQELNSLKDKLKAAESELNSKKSTETSAASEVDKLQSQIARLDSTLKLKQLQIQEVEQARNLKKLEQEEQHKLQDLQVKDAYIGWKTNSWSGSLFSNGDLVKEQIYERAVYTESYGGILEIAIELENLEKQYNESLESTKSLQTELTELDKQKQVAAAKLASLKQNTSAASSSVTGLRKQTSQLQSQISFLSKEEQSLLQRERDIIFESGHAGGGKEALVPGEIYFEGRGSDFVTGHGIGLSQGGALGAAVNNGWDYKKIVEFYFPGAKVQKLSSLPANINVTGRGVIPIEDYVAGLGEVADKACEDLGVAFSTNNYWTCWPRETIKAQAVVARTFAARRSGGICPDDSCQVYKGGQAKRWAADATTAEVVIWNGGLADVYYSADNNQGFGTADKETVWGGSRIPYLTNVNDNAFALKLYFKDCKMWCGNWTWRTNSYSPSELKAFVDWSSANGYSSMNPLKTVGTIQTVTVGKDPSQRVNLVKFKGTAGEASVSGRRFKSAWNSWVAATKTKDNRDLIYSFTFSVKQ